MERKKYLLVVIFSFIVISAFGQANKTIYQAYISGNMAGWKKYIDSYNAATNAGKLELINYLYGYIGYSIGKGKNDEAEKYLQRAETLLAELEKRNYNRSMVNAYKSAFIGFKIGLSPIKAPFIGQKSLTFAEKSVALDPTNYLGHIQLGNIAFYKPAMFGGSKTDAMKHYLKAIELMESNPAILKHNWLYLNLLATVINAYYEQNQYVSAKNYCVKTLNIEPEFEWVKKELCPKILIKTRR